MKSPVFFLVTVALLLDPGASALAADGRPNWVPDIVLTPQGAKAVALADELEKVLGGGTAGAAAPALTGSAATLRLASGDFVAGQLSDCGEDGTLRWQGSAFMSPLDFKLASVAAVYFPGRAAVNHQPQPHPTGAYCLELDGGDLLYGNITGMNGDDCQFEAAGIGPLHVRRSAIQRIVRSREGADLVYSGPNTLLEWKQSPEGAWQQDASGVATAQVGASLLGNLGLPKQACIDFAISWTSDPDFTLVLGDSENAAPNPPGVLNVLGQKVRVAGAVASPPPSAGTFRVEVCDHRLLLLVEKNQKADLVPLQTIPRGTGRCHFRIYLDQERGRAIATSVDGKVLGDLAVPDAASGPGTSLRLINHSGNVRLEQVTVTRWNGQPPRGELGEDSRVIRADGSVLNGHIEGFDAATKEFVLSGPDGQTSRVRADAVESIVLPTAPHLPNYQIRAVCANGARLSGNLRKVENGRVWLGRPGIAEPLAVELSSLHSLLVLENHTTPPQSGGRSGRLEGDGLRLQGSLVDSGSATGTSSLVWRPAASATSSPLKADFSGRIVYRDVPEPSSQVGTVNQNQQGQGVMMVQAAAPQANAVFIMGGVLGFAVNANSPTSQPQQPAPWKGPALHLRTGDTIACEVKQIDERGVTFHSPQFDATFVPNEQVKAVELENRSQATKIDLAKRDRLLTLPRAEKDDPPTHLIRSTDGDYLRGRLVSMDDKTLTVDVRLDTRQVPRDRVASIIWLDKPQQGAGSKEQGAADKEKGDKEKGASLISSNGTAAAELPGLSQISATAPFPFVQSLRGDGVRLTFRPEKLVGAVLRGTSDALGACRVDVGEVDQLIIGKAIHEAAQALPFQRWALQPAVEPKFAQGGEGSGSTGMESDLVGKPAPDFELETLDGQRFRLSNQRNKIVVVDFWATWCGPCRQTLPELIRTAAKYQDRNVVLLTVNLQETPEAIHTMMEKLELKMPVALDRDGSVAEKYAAVAIPQTVIIDGKGNLARLFVGGGPQYADDLSAALDALLKGPADEHHMPEGHDAVQGANR